MSDERKPTEEQQAVMDSAADRSAPSLMVTAFAGCAKTTTMEMASKGVREGALALAFNRTIADELRGRLAPNFICKTLNSFGMMAWSQNHRVVEVVPRKLGQLINRLWNEDHPHRLKDDDWLAVRDTVSDAMGMGIVPGNEGYPLTDDADNLWQALAEENNLLDADRFEELLPFMRQVLRESNKMSRAGVISFDDQVYCPVVLGARWPRYGFVAVDEAQDLNALNFAMIKAALNPGGRLMAVGDPKQAIYGFRGADYSSMDRLRDLRVGWKDLPLSMTFRCPKLVVQRQAHHARGFRAYEGNRDGRLHRFEGLRANSDGVLLGGWNGKKLLSQVEPGQKLAVLCRNNAPLVKLAYRLLREQIPPFMLGRDIGKGLIALSKKIVPEDSTPRDVIAGKVREWKQEQQAIAAALDDEEKMESIADRAESIIAVLEAAEPRDAGQMRRVLEDLFAKSDGQVTLSSIHKAKGKEWDVVLHLDPWRVPSKRALREAEESGDQRALAQEWNLLYVCETRTRDVLIEANMEDYSR